MQHDGVALGFSLRPVFTNIVMVVLERTIIPSLSNK